jgi:hypothetical protein
MEKKRSSILIILIAIVSILSILAMIPYQEEEIPPEPKEKKDVWEIYGEEVIAGETIILSGDVVVKDGGKLTLENSKLIMDNSDYQVYDIVVEEGGELYARRSLITVRDNEKTTDHKTYLIEAYGRFNIINCTVRYISIQIYSNESSVIGSEISESPDAGIYIRNCSPRIMENSIHHNEEGIRGNNAFSDITNNNISFNTMSGLSFYKCSQPNVSQNSVQGSINGLTLRECENVIINENNFTGNDRGILSEYSYNCSITNVVLNSSYRDLSISYSSLFISDCYLLGGDWYGIHSSDSDISLINCSIYSEGDIQLFNTSAKINNNTIDGKVSVRDESNASISYNSFLGSAANHGSGIYVQTSSAQINNNAISDFYEGINVEDTWGDGKNPVSIKYNRIINASYGIQSHYAKRLLIQENEIEGSVRYDIDLQNCEAIIINSIYPEDMTRLLYSSVIFYNHLSIKVIDENEIPLDADVFIVDENGNTSYEGTCDEHGRIFNIPLEYRYLSPAEDLIKDIYTVKVSHGNNEIITSVKIDSQKDLTIILADLGDLEIIDDDLNLSEDIVENEEIVDFQVIVHNKGTGTITNTTASFFIEGISIGQSHIDEIAPGGNATAAIEWTANVGKWEVIVVVFADGKEINPAGNNEASGTIKVVERLIDSIEYYSYETWEVNGDVLISEGGLLELDNVKIIMNSTEDQLLWSVYEGGDLIMNNCNISAKDDFYPYEFKINGKATLDRSVFTGMGDQDSNENWWINEPGGIQIYSDDVRITNSTIRNPDMGIYCQNSAPMIINNTIIDNENVGIYSTKSNVSISQNTISSNNWYGIYIEGQYNVWDYEPKINNNSISESETGIYVLYSKVLISNNTIFNNSQGLDCYRSKVIINKNRFLNNHNGIIDDYGNVSVIDMNVIQGNDIGIELYNSIININGNEITGNEYGIKIGDANYEDSSTLFIENNTISSNSESGILAYGFFPVITNNTIGNNSDWGIVIFNGDAHIEGNAYEFDNRSNGKGRIVKRITITVRVRDAIGRYIEDASLKITYSNGTETIYEKIPAGSWESRYHVNEAPTIYTQYNNGTESYNECLVEVEKEGVTNSTWITSNEASDVTLVLHLLPDLEVKEIEVGKYFLWVNDGRKPREGDNITIRIYAYNHGNGTALNVPVKTFIDGKLVNEKVIPRILPKSTDHINFKWIVKPGNHNFAAQLDPENQIQELSENNNHDTIYKKFDSLPEDHTTMNTILIVCLIFMIMTFIFWIRWRYETWRRD